VNAIMNFRVPKKRLISWLAEKLLASQEGLCSMELVSYSRPTFIYIYDFIVSVALRDVLRPDTCFS
jgi:hypothetical protein